MTDIVIVEGDRYQLQPPISAKANARAARVKAVAAAAAGRSQNRRPTI